MATQEAKTEAKKGRGKKGEGPVTVSYIDKDGKEHKRVPDGVVAVSVANKQGKSKTYKVGELSAPVMGMLAAMMLGKRMDIFVRNSAKNDANADVISLADTVFANLKEGKVYNRAEGSGAGAGRPFDYDFWVEVIQEVAKAKKQNIGEKEIKAFRNKLESAAPADRRTMILKWQKDKVFSACMHRIKAQRATATAKAEGSGDYDAMKDLF